MVREPTIVAAINTRANLLNRQGGSKDLGQNSREYSSDNPIVNSVISDYDMTVAMLKDLVSRITSFSLCPEF